MRRPHRRIHVLLWFAVAAAIATLGIVVMTQSRPNAVESYKPPAQ